MTWHGIVVNEHACCDSEAGDRKDQHWQDYIVFSAALALTQLLKNGYQTIFGIFWEGKVMKNETGTSSSQIMT